jgi:hypothetical protein
MASKAGDLPISMGPVSITRETAKAILVLFPGGREAWIPQSAVHDDSEAWKQGDKGKLVICAWFARARGWD